MWEKENSPLLFFLAYFRSSYVSLFWCCPTDIIIIINNNLIIIIIISFFFIGRCQVVILVAVIVALFLLSEKEKDKEVAWEPQIRLDSEFSHQTLCNTF